MVTSEDVQETNAKYQSYKFNNAFKISPIFFLLSFPGFRLLTVFAISPTTSALVFSARQPKK